MQMLRSEVGDISITTIRMSNSKTLANGNYGQKEETIDKQVGGSIITIQ